MNERIKNGVEELFRNKPHNDKNQEFKEELIANLEDKYVDFIKNGKSEDEAYHLVISSIGELDEVIDNTPIVEKLNQERIQKEKEKTARIVAISIGIYTLALIGGLFFILEGDFNLGITIFLFISGIATCLLVYHFLSRPNYKEVTYILSEEDKKADDICSARKKIYQSSVAIMWLIITILYFAISFQFFNWYCSWIIFIVGAVMHRIIKLIFQIYEMREKDENK